MIDELQEVRFNRTFQVWRYTVSHAQVLLRATKSAESPTRIDILFKDVSVLCLSTILASPTISTTARAIPGLDPELLENRVTYTVTCANFSGFVVAASIASVEDEGEFYDPTSLMSPLDQ